MRRVRRLNPQQVSSGQAELFPDYRHHAVFTDSPLSMLDAEAAHRDHALIEQVIADLKSSALTHLPSGMFTANAAWTVLAAIAFNLTRPAGALASASHARATTATIRRRLILLPRPGHPVRPPPPAAPPDPLALAARVDGPVHRKLRTTRPPHPLSTRRTAARPAHDQWKRRADRQITHDPTHPHRRNATPSPDSPRNTIGESAFSGPALSSVMPCRAVYAGGLAFAVAMSQTLAAELAGTGVRVQVVCPGVVATEFHERQGMDLSAVPRMSAADVVTASLRGLEIGEVVVAPGVEDTTLLDAVFAADLAAFGGQSPQLATRYRTR